MRENRTTVALDGTRIDRVLDGQIEIVEAARADRYFPARVSESLGICLKLGPAHEVMADGRNVAYPADAVCLRSPGCIWSTKATGPVGFLSIDIDGSLLPAGFSGSPMMFMHTGALPDLGSLVRSLRGPTWRQESMELVTDLLLALSASNFIRADELRDSVGPRISLRARDALESSIAAPPTLADLARDFGISRFALLRRFKKDFGVTPHAFVLRLRVERARQRIARGGDLAAIASDLGFADQPHFTRVFRRIAGLTPGEYASYVRPVVLLS